LKILANHFRARTFSQDCEFGKRFLGIRFGFVSGARTAAGRTCKFYADKDRAFSRRPEIDGFDLPLRRGSGRGGRDGGGWYRRRMPGMRGS
jgi:hypothetical protein